MDKHERAAALAACPEWEWMDGMLTTCRLRLVEGDAGYAIGHRSGDPRLGNGWYDGPSHGLLPDYDDPATYGCAVVLAERKFGVLVDVEAAVNPADTFAATAWHPNGSYADGADGASRGEAVADLFLSLSQARKDGDL